MSGRKTDNITRVDIRIPNELYDEISQIAVANFNAKNHHRSNKPEVTPTILELIRIGIAHLDTTLPATDKRETDELREAIATITTNPYQLAIDIFGIGFLTADKIAVNVGVSPWSKFRYQAGVLHVLDKASEDSHCYLPESKLVPMSRELLTTDEHEAEESAIANT